MFRRYNFHDDNRATSFQRLHRPKIPPFDAKALRKTVEDRLSRDEISYLVEAGIQNGNNLTKLKKDQKFNQTWMKICPEDKNMTPSRICNAFPDVTCEYLQNCPIKPISLQACIEAAECPEFPTVARHSSCASLVPENFNFRAEVLEVVMMANMMFSEKIETPELALLSPKEKFKRNFEFVMKSFHSPVMTEGDRWEWCNRLGIVTEDCVLSEAWMVATAAAGRWILKKYKCSLRAWGTSDIQVQFF